MQRRAFIQSIAAALFAPTALLQIKPDKPLDPETILSHFVDDVDCSRYEITEPFPIGGLVYATDVRAIIRCELFTVKDDGEPKRRPDVERLWTDCWQPAKWESFTLPKPEQLTHHADHGLCPYCDNRRVSHGDEYPPDNDVQSNLRFYDYDVDDNTSRDPSCPACRGRDFTGPNVMMLCGQPFYYSSLKRLSLIPGVVVSRSNGRVKTVKP